jgi:hypothetical protein
VAQLADKGEDESEDEDEEQDEEMDDEEHADFKPFGKQQLKQLAQIKGEVDQEEKGRKCR